MAEASCDIGLIGLAVMGQNLVLNMNDHGFKVAVFNRSDSKRRTKELAEKGILFIGTGVSGGEEGARNGPSIMPGGNPAAWPHLKPIFQGIAAKVEDGTPCCD